MKTREQFASARDTEAQPASKCEIEKLDRSFRSRLCASAQEFLWSIQEARSYVSGSVIFRMGDPPDGIYLLESGEAGLWVERPGQFPLLLRAAKPGEALGLSACISGRNYEASAIAISKCEVAFVSGKNLAEFVERFPDAWVCISQLLTHDLLGAYRQVTRMREAQRELV
jgi:CRP-like cAMP-binding protein